MAKSPPPSKAVSELISAFRRDLNPLESQDALCLLVDNRTGAHYCECHVRAAELIKFGTTDVPLDPLNQPDYRANRTLVDKPAFRTMKADAMQRRSFSNIVTEYIAGNAPLKVIGGQHRFGAIREALAKGVNELHGIKVYFGLDMAQRLDVQLISNTNIDVSGALVDRLQETYRGPALRNWCQDVGLLKPDQDFGDTKRSGATITVDLARTFIKNFYDGKSVDTRDFKDKDTTPVLFKSGRGDDDWGDFLAEHEDIWSDAALKEAGKQFVRLMEAQRSAFKGKKAPKHFVEKATNAAVLSAWAYTAGMLQKNKPRLAHHYALADTKGRDPLNAAALTNGKHRSDGSNYRGLGYRTDPRECGSMVELFFILAEDGEKVTAANVQAAIYAWFSKRNHLESEAQRRK